MCDTGFCADQSAPHLAQAAWDALRILGYDTDGDPTPAAFTTKGYGQLGRVLIETAKDVRACYDEALDAMPDEPRRYESDAALDHDDEPELSQWANEHGYDFTPGQWPSPIRGF